MFKLVQAEARTQSRQDAKKPTASGFTTEPVNGERDVLMQKKKAQQHEVRTLLNLQMEKKQELATNMKKMKLDEEKQ